MSLLVHLDLEKLPSTHVLDLFLANQGETEFEWTQMAYAVYYHQQVMKQLIFETVFLRMAKLREIQDKATKNYKVVLQELNRATTPVWTALSNCPISLQNRFYIGRWHSMWVVKADHSKEKEEKEGMSKSTL